MKPRTRIGAVLALWWWMPGAALAATEIANGGSVMISGPTDSVQDFYLNVPSSPYPFVVTFVTSGGTGDPDIIVSYGPYTSGNADCVSAAAGTAERCDVYEPAPGAWYVKVLGYTSYSNVTLTARYSTATPLMNGVPVTGLSASAGQGSTFYLDVPRDHNVDATLSGGTGNADLTAFYVLNPTTVNVACLSDGPANAESCASYSFGAERWYFTVTATTSYASVELVAGYSGGGGSGGGSVPPAGLLALALAALLRLRGRSGRVP